MTYQGPTSIRSARCARLSRGFLLGPDLEVVLEHDRLAVEVKGLYSRVLLEQIEQPSTRPTRRKRNCSSVRYHSRSQWVCETTWTSRSPIRHGCHPFDGAGGEAGDEESLQEHECGDHRARVR